MDHRPAGQQAPAARRRLWGLVAALDARPLVLVTLGMLVFSTGPVLVAAATTSGAVLSFWRLWFGAVLLGALTLWRGHAHGVRASLRGWGWTAAAGTAFGIHQLMFMVAIMATSVVDVTLMQVLLPVIVGALAVVLFGERPGATFRLWSLLAVAGAGVVVLAGTTGPEGDPAGMALAVGNVVFAAFYFVWAKRATTEISALPFLFGVAVVAAVVVSGFTVVVGDDVTAVDRRDLVIAAAIAILPGVLGHFLSTYPLPRVAANIPPVIWLAIPFVSGGLAWLLLGQRITWLHVVGGMVTIAGVVGALLSHRPSPVPESHPDRARAGGR